MPGNSININVSDKAAALQGVVQQVGRAIQGQSLQSVIPQVRSGQLTPGAALDQIVQIGQNAVQSVQAVSAPAGTTPREVVTAAQSAAREQVAQARTALQQVASQRNIETMLDPVGQAITGTAREAGRTAGQAAGQAVERSVNRATAVAVKTGIGAGIGAAVATVFDKSPSSGAIVGALAGLVFGFATGRRG